MKKPDYSLHQVTQCVREVRPGGGVCGVAYELDTAMRSLGLQVNNFTLADVGISEREGGAGGFYSGKLRLMRDVVVYSIVGSLKIRRSAERRRTICHTDALFGRVYVNHGLHRAAMDASGRKWFLFFRNPLHIFLWVREWVRFRFDVHDYFVCFSQADAATLLSYFPRAEGRIRIIPNGVNIHRFRPSEDSRRKFRRQHDLRDDELVLCFIGHEFERKGLYPAIEALASLPLHVRLVVAGGRGKMIEDAKRFAGANGVAGRVLFLGAVSNVAEVLNGTEALLLPSKYESWALVGLEAMACGKPAIMKPTGGISEYLHDGVNGFWIDDDPLDIANAIGKLLGMNSEEWANMSRAAKETAARYSWCQIAEKYIDLLG